MRSILHLQVSPNTLDLCNRTKSHDTERIYEAISGDGTQINPTLIWSFLCARLQHFIAQ